MITLGQKKLIFWIAWSRASKKKYAREEILLHFSIVSMRVYNFYIIAVFTFINSYPFPAVDSKFWIYFS